MEVGSAKSEMGSAKSEVGNGKWEVRSRKWEMGSAKCEMGLPQAVKKWEICAPKPFRLPTSNFNTANVKSPGLQVAVFFIPSF